MKATYVNGFKLEVNYSIALDGPSKVRVSLSNGKVIMDTDAVSIIGLERLPEVFEAAARIAKRQVGAI